MGAVGLALYFAEPLIHSDRLLSAATHLERVMLIGFTVLVFRFFKAKYRIAAILKFMGENTLAILGYHLLVLIPIGRLAHKLSGGAYCAYLIGVPCSILTALVLYYVIGYSNRHFPALMGRGHVVK